MAEQVSPSKSTPQVVLVIGALIGLGFIALITIKLNTETKPEKVRKQPKVHTFQTFPATIALGTISLSQSASAELICWSATRPELDLTIAGEDLDEAAPCVEWSSPIALTEQEKRDFAQQLSQESAVKVQCAYRLKVTVHQSRALENDGKKSDHQLDIGPIEFRLVVTNEGDPEPIKVPVFGMVSGNVQLEGTQLVQSRIELGQSFNASYPREASVSVFSDQDLELLSEETRPEYLKVSFLYKGTIEGRKKWDLKVIVPSDSVVGSLPRNSRIVLRMKDAEQRRIQIPIRGAGYSEGYKINNLAREFAGADVTGKTIKLSDYKGKVVLLDFWATWCGPCVALIPRERELAQKYEKSPFVILGICNDQRRNLQKFLDREALPWPNIIENSESVTRAWKVEAFPTWILIDHHGVVQGIWTGGQDIDEVEDAVAQAVQIAETK